MSNVHTALGQALTVPANSASISPLGCDVTIPGTEGKCSGVRNDSLSDYLTDRYLSDTWGELPLDTRGASVIECYHLS
ncbi:hypothetical protein J6590_074604 [Homalodisca vitripennis]|nr:hypothetical protein J6590_074604 [Homalodisca vitripennis]